MYVSRTKDEEHHEDCLRPRFSKKNFIMIWGGIHDLTGRKLLVIWEKDNWDFITAQAYLDHILEPVVYPFFQQFQWTGIIFMDDNAPAHRAKIVNEFKEQHFMTSLNWPSNSPDLNPIENLWNVLKTRLQARNPRPRTLPDVKQAVIEEWDSITADEIDKYVDSMPEHIQAVVDNHEGHTRW